MSETMTTTLHALLTRVEAAEGTDRDIDREIEHVLCGVPRCEPGMQIAYPERYTASLDAITALVTSRGFGWSVDVTEGACVSDEDDIYDATLATPVLSLCAAWIKAEIARVEDAESVVKTA